jgi:hypothetical protein
LSRAPDYVHPIAAWRAWFVVTDGEALRLSSFVYPTLWPPRRELVATCRHRPFSLLRPWRRRPPPGHGAPEETCRCGIYGAAEPELAAAYLEDRLLHAEPFQWPILHRVIGRVSLWGSVVECHDGWRASCAYPERLFVPCLNEAQEICDATGFARELTSYRVPIELLEHGPHEDVAPVLRSRTAALPRTLPLPAA